MSMLGGFYHLFIQDEWFPFEDLLIAVSGSFYFVLGVLAVLGVLGVLLLYIFIFFRFLD